VMGLDGDLCLAEPSDYSILVGLAFEETKRLVTNGSYGIGSRERIACSLVDAFGLASFDLGRIFWEMDNRYQDRLISLGVMFLNPEYKKLNL